MKLIKIALVVFVFFTGMEVAARVDDLIKYGAPFFGEYIASRLRTRDIDRIKHNVPGSRFEKWEINDQGFRGPEISITRPGDVHRIVCMGASETFGLYENKGKEWPSQLADMLKKEKRFEVINASVVGLELRGYKAYLSKYVMKFQPDIVILMVNPFAYAAGKYKPQKKSESHSVTDVAILSGIKKNANAKFVLSGISPELRVLPKIKQTVKQALPQDIVSRYQTWNMIRQVRNIEKNRLNGIGPLDNIRSENIAIFKKDLRDLIHYLNEEKIRVVLCSYPVLISEANVNQYPAIFNDHRRFYIELSLKGLIDVAEKFNQAINETAHSHHVDFVDLDMAVPNTIEFFGDNVHYTDKGAQIVASKLRDKLGLIISN